jgi:hypothetical protein
MPLSPNAQFPPIPKSVDQKFANTAWFVHDGRQTACMDDASTKLGWQNFVYLLQQAVQAGRTAELSAHPLTQALLQQFQENS